MFPWVIAVIVGIALTIGYYAWYQRGDLVASVAMRVRDQVSSKGRVDVRRRVGTDWRNPEVEFQVRTSFNVTPLVLDPTNARFLAEAFELAAATVRGED